MKLFAGFWRDGAEVKPEEDHWKKRRIVACWKDSEWYEVLSDCFTNWHQVYWLDTTTPTELSPQEAFELLKVINPDAERLEDDGGDWVLLEPGSDIINWGDLTEYPPRQRWRVPTDADKGKPCRYKDEEKAEWMNRDNVLFMSTWNEGFWVVYGNEAPCFWKHCEVQDET